jgi:hypothetical protein
MKKLLAAAALTLAMVGISASASAASLTYGFTMTVTELRDATEPGPSGGAIFGSAGIHVGSVLTGSVSLATPADGDGSTSITVTGLSLTFTNSTYSNSWSNLSGSTWQGGSGAGGRVLTVNNVVVPNGTASEYINLQFVPSSSGLTTLTGGYMTISVDNGVHAFLRADYTGTVTPPSRTPELDPSSGSAALALLLGGTTLAFSYRRRQSSR